MYVRNTPPFLKFLTSVGGRIIFTVIFALILYATIYALLKTENNEILLGLFVFCGYFGWRSLNKITPNVFLIMSIGKWVVYILVKGFLSAAIGVFITPFWLGKKLSEALTNLIS